MKRADSAGKTHKRRELMADGRRYIIYYTFLTKPKNQPPNR